MLTVLHAQRTERGIKNLAVGLFTVHFFRNEHILHKIQNAGFPHTAALHPVKAIGHYSQCCHFGKLPEHVQHVGRCQVRVGRELIQIEFIHLHTVACGIHCLQKAGEPLPHQLVPADLTLFQLPPELLVDGAVGLHRLGIRLNAVLPQGVSQRLVFRCIKIQQRIISIKQNTIVFCHGSLPLFHTCVIFRDACPRSPGNFSQIKRTARSQPRPGRAGFRLFLNYLIGFIIGLHRGIVRARILRGAGFVNVSGHLLLGHAVVHILPVHLIPVHTAIGHSSLTGQPGDLDLFTEHPTPSLLPSLCGQTEKGLPAGFCFGGSGRLLCGLNIIFNRSGDRFTVGLLFGFRFALRSSAAGGRSALCLAL